MLQVMQGYALSLFADVLRFPLIGSLIVTKIKRDNDFEHLRSFAASVPNPSPLFFPYNATNAAQLAAVAPAVSTSAFSHPTAAEHPRSRILRLRSRYVSGDTDPSKIIKLVLDAIIASNSSHPPLNSFLSACANASADAEASTQRWKLGQPLSLLDGVPVGVKVEFEVLGEPLHHQVF